MDEIVDARTPGGFEVFRFYVDEKENLINFPFTFFLSFALLISFNASVFYILDVNFCSVASKRQKALTMSNSQKLARKCQTICHFKAG